MPTVTLSLRAKQDLQAVWACGQFLVWQRNQLHQRVLPEGNYFLFAGAGLLDQDRMQSQAGFSMTKFTAQYNAETQCV